MFYLLKIVFFIFLILIFIIFNQKHNREYFLNYNFKNKKYLNYFNLLDFKLRKLDKKNSLRIYNNFIQDFSEKEKIIVTQIKYDINIIFDKLFYTNIFSYNFLKVNNNIENSLPHTRNNYVLFSQKIYDKFLEMDKVMIIKNKNYFKLFFHEIFHIFQRNNPKLINILYTKYWNLIEYKKKLPNKLKNIIRTNPDALPDNNWIVNLNDKYIISFCIYKKDASNITDTLNIYLELDEHLEFIDIDDYKNLNELESYSNYFGINNSNNYHPNELSSSIFEDIIYDRYYQVINNNSLAYFKMIDFLKNYCYLKN